MARVQVLRKYRPATFSGKRSSTHFQKQREWASRILRCGGNRPAFEILPSSSGFAGLKYRMKSWLSWRGFYFVRAVTRRLTRLRSIWRNR